MQIIFVYEHYSNRRNWQSETFWDNILSMPKLYKSIKVEQGLKIGLRESSGSEWFADMTIDRDRRTCRKIKLRFDPTDKEKAGKPTPSLSH